MDVNEESWLDDIDYSGILEFDILEDDYNIPILENDDKFSPEEPSFTVDNKCLNSNSGNNDTNNIFQSEEQNFSVSGKDTNNIFLPKDQNFPRENETLFDFDWTDANVLQWNEEDVTTESEFQFSYTETNIFLFEQNETTENQFSISEQNFTTDDSFSNSEMDTKVILSEEEKEFVRGVLIHSKSNDQQEWKWNEINDVEDPSKMEDQFLPEDYVDKFLTDPHENSEDQQVIPPPLDNPIAVEEPKPRFFLQYSIYEGGEDDYNWRKYGQKQVKGCAFPRSYYKCTHPGCKAKKKIEKPSVGHVWEIIYGKDHNHPKPPPPPNRPNVVVTSSVSVSEDQSDTRMNEEMEGVFRTVRDPSFILEVISPTDTLSDGYRWRKYGQKVVKGNENPRSYYKCTAPKCKVRKHVERSSTNKEALLISYQGKHDHEKPPAKNSGGSGSSSQSIMPSHSQKEEPSLPLVQNEMTRIGLNYMPPLGLPPSHSFLYEMNQRHRLDNGPMAPVFSLPYPSPPPPYLSPPLPYLSPPLPYLMPHLPPLPPLPYLRPPMTTIGNGMDGGMMMVPRVEPNMGIMPASNDLLLPNGSSVYHSSSRSEELFFHR